MKNSIKQLFNLVVYVLAIHALGLAVMSISRLILFFANNANVDFDFGLFGKSLLIGLRFDNIIASYISFFALLFLLIFFLASSHNKQFPNRRKTALKITNCYYCILYSLLIFIHIANARYYTFFDNHLTFSVVEWFKFAGETAGLIFDDAVNIVFLCLSVIFIVGFILLIVRIYKREMAKNIVAANGVFGKILTALLGIAILFLCFTGMRGGWQQYPLRVSAAYFSDNQFYNKLGINPAFYIIKSINLNNNDYRPALPINNLEENEAVKYVQTALNFQAKDSVNPIVRQVSKNDTAVCSGQNVVLILMESMSVRNLTRTYKNQPLTPFLNELQTKSLYFSNFYSAGIHTNNGIAASIYGYTPHYAKTMLDVVPDLYTGLPYWFKRAGYQTLGFITGDANYDNMSSFFYSNSISQVYTQFDYDNGEIVNNFGVSDATMLSYGLKELSRKANEQQPFFAFFLTVSNHPPYIVPAGYENRGSNDEQKIIAYADNTLREFVEKAQQTEWGKNTVFVLVGDHGQALDNIYEMPLNYNQVPCFIINSKIAANEIKSPAMQIDLFPTILELCGIEYENNSLGINLLKQKHKYAFFVSNEHLGCSDGNLFYCYNILSNEEKVYKIGSWDNVAVQYQSELDSMRNFASNMLLVNELAKFRKWTCPREKTVNN